MEVEVILAIGMFAVAIVALLAGFPVAFTLGGVALIFAFIGISLDVFDLRDLKNIAPRIEGVMNNNVLIAVPLFVIMGVILERSRIAEDLLGIASRLLGGVRGGLGYSVVLVGALLAASTGIVGATVITMTLIALPSMLKQGYDPRLATGTIAASGTLGQIIPPSIVLILLADAISNASAQAATSLGNVTSAISVQDLFSGALIPGVLLVGFYLLWIAFNAYTKPERAPAMVFDEDLPPLTFKEIAFGLGAPLLLIFAVLGSILLGITPPTEAAAIGAAGAALLAGIRLSEETGSRLKPVLMAGLAGVVGLLVLNANFDLSVKQSAFSSTTKLAIGAAYMCILALIAALASGLLVLRKAGHLNSALSSAAHITSMVFVILIGASLFSLVFTGGYRGDEMIEALLTAMPGGVWGALVITMLVMFVLGFFLDFIEIIFIVVPLVAPPLIVLGVDPIWLAILMALNLQTSFLTPPFGFALFYLRGVAPDGVETIDIWRGAIPFIGLQLAMILLVAAFPALATWLPSITTG